MTIDELYGLYRTNHPDFQFQAVEHKDLLLDLDPEEIRGWSSQKLAEWKCVVCYGIVNNENASMGDAIAAGKLSKLADIQSLSEGDTGRELATN